MANELIGLMFNPKALIIIALILIYMFGGSDFIFRNPTVIIFGIVAMIVFSLGGRK